MNLSDADSIYLGGLVDAVYMGDTLVWSPEPAGPVPFFDDAGNPI